MATVFKKPHALIDKSMHYCPGCTHGIVHRIIAEVLDELEIEGKTVGISPVGCTYNNYEYFNCDMVQAAHGRAPAVGTGVKRANPDNVVFTYQGDGDLAAIGTAEIVHAATRGEKITTIFVNNAIYGMTSGQMAPTTLIDQVTTTSPFGRKPEIHGFPIKVCELLSTLEGAVFVERVSLHDVKNIMNAKKAIKKAFQVQMANLGFGIVEVLSSCPTNWGMHPVDALGWIKDKMVPFYPLGNFKGKDLEV
ncbi:thiamine pyrophosphate-dependent enzyme [Acetivibrio cellulolyticus]|uniref:thiamine pyrophosphate-dependent enzyme n=1 Tax=Acetivibrio cellulolyticus TaxID=35830 RepID=UPI0001E2D16C|nr:thiamine pyrophosphate-dependent enzyme [Acetivibrio cellulolyticus]